MHIFSWIYQKQWRRNFFYTVSIIGSLTVIVGVFFLGILLVEGPFPPLHDAARSGDSQQVEQLLDGKSVDINARFNEGSTALMIAAFNHNIDVVRVLLEAGADVNLQNDFGSTALMEAVLFDFEGDTQVLLEVLLEAGANIYVKDEKGLTAMDHAQEEWVESFLRTWKH